MTAAWPFLIARGRGRDYRTVLLPGALTDPAAATALADALPIGEPDGPPRTATIDHGILAGCRVRTRTALLRPTDLGANGDGAPFVTDEHGRPLVYLFGLLSPAAAAGAPDESHMAAAGDAALRAYRSFLADEHAFTAALSDPVEVPALPRSDAGERSARPVGAARRTSSPPAPSADHRATPRPQPVPRRARTGPVALVFAGVAAALVLVLVLATRGGSTLHDLDVEVADEDGTTPCAEVRLTATLTVDGARTVRFHWRSGDREVAEPQSRDLGTGPQTVTFTPRLELPTSTPGDEHEITLVAQPDDGDAVSEQVVVQCSAADDDQG
jgi:hypothetical protein